MKLLMQRSLTVNLLSIYLLFVITVMIGGGIVNTFIEQQLRADAQASNQALAQEIAFQTSLQLQNSEDAIVTLGQTIAQTQNIQEVARLFQSFKSARSDVDYMYWLDSTGEIRLSWPEEPLNIGGKFSLTQSMQQAKLLDGPVFQVGMADDATFNPGIVIVAPIRDSDHNLTGFVATSLTLVELSVPLITVVQAQVGQGYHLDISILDNEGKLIASPHHNMLLQNVTNILPGAADALKGQISSRLGVDMNGEEWLFSSVPVPDAGWAVVVQRPTNEALVAVSQLHAWLLVMAILFGLGGLLFWLFLFRQVIRPLHDLAKSHQMMPASENAISIETLEIASRNDEVGDLARSLLRLEYDGLTQLRELRILLKTSNAVVGSLDPHAVVGAIIQEVRRLVNVQAASVLVPDESNVLRVLVGEGYTDQFKQALSLSPEDGTSAAVQAFRNGKPVQRLLGAEHSLGYDDGFRSVLAIPIISRHVGRVILLVHRRKAQIYSQKEIDLLLTFANYATLAWEHAILYERSDERLREVAIENEQLYKQATQEKQTLEAIMRSINDGLLLTGSDGSILYANRGANALLGLPNINMTGYPIAKIFDSFQTITSQEYLENLQHVANGEISEHIIEVKRQGHRQIIHFRMFDVNDASGCVIGQGLLLRDVTREYEQDEFKTTLLAAVSHEVRTPLASIKGNASALLQEDVAWSVGDQRHFLQSISKEADRLAQLVSNLLDLSRQEAGLLLLQREPVSMEEIIDQILLTIDNKHIHVTLEIEQDLPFISLDRSRIEIVLNNLISNAAVYGNGDIHIVVNRAADSIRLAVSDNGLGIDEEDLPYIFNRFYRAHYGSRRRSAGIGLGLAICKAFIEAHGGTIRAYSSGHGATFSFTLPCHCE